MMDVSSARSEYFDTSGKVIRRVRPGWAHLMIGGASLPQSQAQAEVDVGLLDLVTYGRWLIANPDLVLRFKQGQPPLPFDRAMLDRLE